jgi:inositol phosphorylceramide synthase catalytic subunit
MLFQRFTVKNISINIAFAILYLSMGFISGGIRNDHIIVLLIWLVAFYSNNNSRRLIVGFSIFIIYWIVYDWMRIIPNYEVSTVHIRQPYDIEKSLFGICVNQRLLTPNEYFSLYNNKILDFLSGLFYINWVPVPIAFAVYLYIKDKTNFLKFSFLFLLVNLLGFAIYYLYPAAPPWYVDMHGFDLKIGVPGNRAGLSRFDELVGIPVFANIYNKNANVLAAIPSLHSAYPVVVLFFGVKKKLGWINYLFVIFMIGIWFAAVYSGHHYIIDVILGVVLAVVTIVVFEYVIKLSFLKNKIKKFVDYLSVKHNLYPE